MKNYLALSLLCASVLTPVQAHAADFTARAVALVKATPGKNFVMMDVPSAGNFISNGMILAALKGGTESVHATQIAAMLQAPAPVNLAVSGEHDGIAAATLDSALNSLKGKTVTPQELVFVGNTDTGAALTAKAAELGLTLVIAPLR